MQRRVFLAASTAATLAGGLPMTAGAQTADYDLETPTGTLYGTLMLPAMPAAPVPVVLIVAGSGPTDRNGNAPTLALDIYRKLAIALAARGIASVRYDKRGIAASHAALTDEAAVRLETFVDDAARWIARIRSDSRFSRIALAGHSEGALVGMLAGQRVALDAFVSLEGPGLPAGTVLREQLMDRLKENPDLLAAANSIVSALEKGTLVLAAQIPAELLPLFRPSVQPFVISLFRYDPRREIAKLETAVTIVQGTHDLQVSIENGRALATANPRARYVVIDNLTHVLADDPGTTLEQQLSGAYADAARPIDATVIATLVSVAAGS